jgi:hypothetical protein
MFDLNQRQRALLLKGLELLRQQPQPKGRDARTNGALAEASIAELTALLRTGKRQPDAVHQHPVKGRNRPHKIVGECTAHGSICIGCQISYHLADGPLEWCRECDLLLAAVEEVTRPTARRRKGQAGLGKTISKAKR